MLAWVDILAGAVHIGVPGELGLATISVGEHVSSIIPTADAEVVVVAVRSGLATLHLPSGSLNSIWAGPWAADVRPNDSKCGPDGALWLGALTYCETPRTGVLYRIDPGLNAVRVLAELTIPNGMDWREDSDVMVFTDSPTRRVDELRLGEVGAIVDRQTFVETGPRGVPDGLTLDREGGLWVVLHGVGEVRRYGPDASLLTVVHVPTPSVTSCTFGGDDMRTLFITSSTCLADPVDAAAGAVYACRPGPQGRPALPYTLAGRSV